MTENTHIPVSPSCPIPVTAAVVVTGASGIGRATVQQLVAKWLDRLRSGSRRTDRLYTLETGVYPVTVT